MRRARHRAILELVREREIHSQAELVEALEERGLQVTQGTVSRDVRQLRLLKVPLEGGGSRYAPPDEPASEASGNDVVDRLRSIADSVTAIDEGEALLLLKTPSGHANAVAVTIDACRLPEIAGSLAGDDTILLVLRQRGDRARLRRRLEEIFA